MSLIPDFVRLSKYAGQRVDWIQAGGGNASVKLSSETMIIKCSGLNLSEIEIDKGYATINHKKLISFIENSQVKTLGKPEREKKAFEIINEALFTKDATPSIETLFHALLGQFVLHTHPIVVNAITCRLNWKEVLATHFLEKAVFIDYFTPGIDLALELHDAIRKHQNVHFEQPNIFFLRNHGLIVSADTFEHTLEYNERVILSLEKVCQLDFSLQRLSSQISAFIERIYKIDLVVYPIKDEFIRNLLLRKRELLFHPPLFPDYVIYCGAKIVELTSLEDSVALNSYRIKFKSLPRLILYADCLFVVANSLRKAKDIEDVLKSHLLILTSIPNEASPLSEEEIHYLLEWEAEKYRQKV